MNWFLINTKPNAHTLARENLIRQGFEVFLPLMIKTFTKSGKFLTKTVPLFPGYLFMGSKLSGIPWKSINATRGVAKAVTLDGSYRPVNGNIIDGIKSRCDKQSVLKSTDMISPGDLIKIERGPFTDFICSVEKITDDERVWVLMEILNQRTRIKVASGDLSKIG